MAGLLGRPTHRQMSYDLPACAARASSAASRTNTYVLTADGWVFYTKVHDRLLVPLLAGDAPPAQSELRQALGSSTARSTTTSAARDRRPPDDLGETPKSRPPRSARPLEAVAGQVRSVYAHGPCDPLLQQAFRALPPVTWTARDAVARPLDTRDI